MPDQQRYGQQQGNQPSAPDDRGSRDRTDGGADGQQSERDFTPQIRIVQRRQAKPPGEGPDGVLMRAGWQGCEYAGA